jgi:hypothetical protein
MEQEIPFVFDTIMDQVREKNSRIALATMLGMTHHFNLACIGSSINGFGAFTFEAVAYMASADVVFYYPPTSRHLELIRLVNANVVDMHESLYRRGRNFDPSYDAIVKHVMETVRTGVKVAYVTQGSPAFHCGTAVSLYRRAKREGYCPVLVSGVSSLELLSVELAPDYDIRNLQILSVIDVMDRKIAINPGIASFLCDLGRYALPTVREPAAAFSRPKLASLAELLSAVYSADHEILLVHIKNEGSCSKSRTNPVNLENALIGFGAVPTLFVPAAKMPF